MDTIRFDIVKNAFGGFDAVPMINDRSLIEILKDVEMPLAEQENTPELAGE